jgi:hypothetical protein
VSKVPVGKTHNGHNGQRDFNDKEKEASKLNTETKVYLVVLNENANEFTKSPKQKQSV